MTHRHEEGRRWDDIREYRRVDDRQDRRLEDRRFDDRPAVDYQRRTDTVNVKPPPPPPPSSSSTMSTMMPAWIKIPDATDSILYLTAVIFFVLILLSMYFYYVAGVEAVEGSESSE